MKAPEIDFHRIAPEHGDIHERLLNWARVFQVRPSRAMTHTAPMWRFTRNSARMFNPPPAVAPPDLRDAQRLEHAICTLPYYEREAICWAYLRPEAPAKVVRRLAITYSELAQALTNARGFLANMVASENKSAVSSKLVILHK